MLIALGTTQLMISCWLCGPQNIYTHPTHPKEGHWKFWRGGGISKARIFKGKYEAKLEFQRGGGSNQKTFCGGGMDIFWNNPLLEHVSDLGKEWEI